MKAKPASHGSAPPPLPPLAQLPPEAKLPPTPPPTPPPEELDSLSEAEQAHAMAMQSKPPRSTRGEYLISSRPACGASATVAAMPNAALVSKTSLLVAVAALACGCDEEKPAAKPAASATAAAAPSALPAAPSATASAAPPAPKHDCPEGTAGDGTFDKPCDAKGTARTMEVTWTGKQDDKGPSFRVVNTSKADILYGKLVVYFYDKAGKQLEVKDDDKARKTKTCAGNIFDGPMKAGEKAVITFSCVKKDHVPEGTAAIQAEIEVAGFTDESGKKNAWYWRNKELTPEDRPRSKK